MLLLQLLQMPIWSELINFICLFVLDFTPYQHFFSCVALPGWLSGEHVGLMT